MQRHLIRLLLCSALITASVMQERAYCSPMEMPRTALRVMRVFKASRSHIAFVGDADDLHDMHPQWVVRQSRKTLPFYELISSLELLAVHLAHVVDVCAGPSYFVPATVTFPGKHDPVWPAVVHTFAEGGTTDRSLILYQSKGSETCALHEKGLVRQIIRSMATHSDLPRIVALDTFIGNNDRSHRNLIYNKSLDRYYGIDFELSFDKDLCAIACDQIKALRRLGIAQLSPEERTGLRIYYDALKLLVTCCPPEKTTGLLDELVTQSGVMNSERSPASVAKLKERVAFHRTMIRTSYINACRLVVYLGQLFE